MPNLIATEDPSVFIESQTSTGTESQIVIYQSVTGERWQINGRCSACGECEVGANDTYYQNKISPRESKDYVKLHYQIWTGNPVGTPEACLDVRFGTRLDIPVRPEISQSAKNCSLSGNYLPPADHVD